MASAIITLERLSKHSTPQDAWIAIHGKVYDVSNFFEDHPGGGEILKDVAGTDSTKDFDYVDHSDDAWRTMEKIQVGILDGWVEKSPSAPQKLARPLKKTRANIRLPKTIIRSLFLGSLILVGLVSVVHGLRSVSAGLKPLSNQGSSTGKKAFIGGFWVGIFITSVAISLLIRAFSNILFPRRKGPWEYPPYFKVTAL